MRLNWKSLAGKFGIDWAIAYTLFARLIQAGGGVGTVVFIAKNLSKDEQGYYYTFGSILAIQVFFELGLCSIITQYVAHEMANLKLRKDGTIEGDETSKSRLASLLHFCFNWFCKISFLLFIVLNVAGYCFFSRYNGNLNIDWQIPWMLLSLTTSCFLILDPLMAFIDGLGKVKEAARMRLVQQTAYVVCVIIFLLSGFKLYSCAVAAFISFVSIATIFISSKNARVLVNIWPLLSKWKVSYRNEIFPYQWKIALSWVSGYFIFQLFNPVLFATEGPVVAGQMGMTLAALNGVLALSMSWINTKIPLFSGLIAKKDYNSLDDNFFKSLRQSLFITSLGLIVLFLFVNVLHWKEIPLGKRFLPPVPLAFLCFSYLMNNIAFSLATYLRCHKQEPMLTQTVVFAILSAFSTLTLGNLYGVFGITCGYFVLGLIVGMPWVLNIFFTKRRLWHQAF